MTQIVSARHTALVVKDLDVSRAFYCDFLGLETLSFATEQGKYIETLVGLSGATLRWVKIKVPGGHLVELIEYLNPRCTILPEELGRPNRPGFSHLAFTVVDIDMLHANMVSAGYKCNWPPQLSPDGRVKVMYAHDPDGNILEMVQEVK